MALEKLRGAWEGVLNPVLESLSGVKPSTVTWVALPIGVLGGLAVLTADETTYGANMLFGGGLLIIMAMILDGLDGPLARKYGNVTRWGDYLDHTFDRLLDAVWILCIAGSVFVGDFALGLAAAWLTLLGSYMGTQAQAVAGTRNYRGFSRADRTILSIVAIFLTGIFIHADIGDFGMFPGILNHIPINPMSVIVLISAFGGLWTFLVRFQQAKFEISQIDSENPLPQPNQAREDE
ncbi:MAG: CDP-alcohol phosphatidyltransferase family protein [Euryarchaeota archaeon]|jgi:archaetidylinositol phosphate synthase|nr:CDP-alcohol phosphatidyltransferase family protein [Euryarchaeota archaeon]MBT5595254.1 CDP-alcohol phosphatidyltransferase family protein [Euryarchaeota archaeon]MBT5844490.1 CDP-alcohol phosphatidyltransferase family protein [Euryarchaeota archaeon]MBT6845016.1 CDP-alcohol phosphatidyltransferase family protein [Euryarchaeota archaeon]MBT7063526.1 CDP-alcohol phosphatidyltransferase family protein [Euryarchaeota archaeon]